MRSTLVSACLVLIACGPVGKDNGGNGAGSGGGGAGSTGNGGGQMSCPQTAACPAGGVVDGRVFAPNGVDPIAGASIYVPTNTEEFPPGVSCDVCNQGFASCRQVFSGPDGSFSLTGVPAGHTEIDIQKGRFRRKLMVDVACGHNSLTPDQSRLPRNSSEGDIPRIAVANGEWDKLECVLRKIGLDAQAIDIFNHSDDYNESGRPDFGALVQNFAMLSQYDIVFINCTDNMLESYLSDPATKTNLKNYVAMGGRLYITDWSYDHIEQVPEWAPLVCWEPTSSSCTGGPEPMHAAALGADSLEVDATIEDQGMADWLSRVGATNPNGTVHITHFLAEWVMQRSNVQPMVKEWVKGPVRSMDGTVNGELPLTITFDYNSCGRVLYSSYHTLGRDLDTCGGLGQTSTCVFPGYCDSNPLSPQERILEFLIFEISTCVNPPG